MIKTRSQFYYGLEITALNQYVDFSEGGPILYAKLPIGLYSHSQLLIALSKAMNEAGAGNYVWNIDRESRILDVSSDITFSLLVSSGGHSTSGIWELLGFQGSDKTGSNSYTATSSSGKRYRPQFLLQNYVSTDQNNGPVESSLNISGSGKRELVRFGTEKIMECSIPYITDFYQPIGGPIENSQTAFADVKDFMEFLIRGGYIEFMPDRKFPSNFETLQLKSTNESQDGISYRIEEMQDVGLQGYFRINKLIFRKIE